MRKWLEKSFLFLTSLFCVFLVPFSVNFKLKTYKGTDFLLNNNYGYVENFEQTIQEFVNKYGDVVINNGELLSSFSDTKIESLFDDKGKKIFEVCITNLYDKDLKNFFMSKYAKTDVYKNNHNANSITFALFGKTSFISYIYNPNKELRYTEYSSMIWGRFSQLNSFSFAERFCDLKSTSKSLDILLLDVGNNYMNIERTKAVKKSAIYTVTLYIFGVGILFLIKRSVELSDLLIIEICVSLFCVIPYLLIRNLEFDILLFLCTLVGIIVSLIWSGKGKNDQII